MYHVDMREQHGTGRRLLRPQDNIQGSLGGPWGSGTNNPVDRKGMGVFIPQQQDPGMLGNRSQAQAQGGGYAQDNYAQSETSSVRMDDATLKFSQSMGRGGNGAPRDLFGRDNADAGSAYSGSRGDRPDCGVFRRDNADAGSAYSGSRGDRPDCGVFRRDLEEDQRDAGVPQRGVYDQSSCYSGSRAGAPDLFGRLNETQESYSSYPYDKEAGLDVRRDDESRGKKFIGVGHNMQDMGTSAPIPERHGRGRAKFEEEDSQPIAHSFEPIERLTPGQGRRVFPVSDTIGVEVLRPPHEFQPTVAPSNDDMKDAIKEWLEEVYGMIVISKKWDEAKLEQHGSNWSIHAISHKGKSLAKDGPTAKMIAEKMSMMQVQELIHFGVRFATKDESERILAAVRHNPTFISGGVRGSADETERHYDLSNGRKDPEELGNKSKYISTGRDHFASTGMPHEDHIKAHSHVKEQGFEGGLPRGIGHGKRFIGSRDQMQGGALI